MTPLDENNVIATRTLDGITPSGERTRIVVSLGMPYPHGNSFRCPVRVAGLDYDYTPPDIVVPTPFRRCSSLLASHSDSSTISFFAADACFMRTPIQRMISPISKSLTNRTKRPNHAMERTPNAFGAVRSTFDMTSTLSLRATRALVRRRSSYSR
jgi:hypothetical protein